MLSAYEEAEETKIIGVYSSREKAVQIIEKYKKLPGFKEYPNAFCIDEYEMDKDYWNEGFIGY